MFLAPVRPAAWAWVEAAPFRPAFSPAPRPPAPAATFWPARRPEPQWRRPLSGSRAARAPSAAALFSAGIASRPPVAAVFLLPASALNLGGNRLFPAGRRLSGPRRQPIFSCPAGRADGGPFQPSLLQRRASGTRLRPAPPEQDPCLRPYFAAMGGAGFK
jgi:hypothetical protein